MESFESVRGNCIFAEICSANVFTDASVYKHLLINDWLELHGGKPSSVYSNFAFCALGIKCNLEFDIFKTHKKNQS